MRDDINFNVQFCELVEQYPALYDYTKPEYSNRSVQDKIWMEIGLKLGEPAKACKDRWKNIRTSYSKSKRSIISPSGSAAKPVKEYYLASSLRFLDNFLKSRPSKGNIVFNTDEIYNNDENESSNMSAGSNAADLQETNLGFTPLRTTPSLPKKTQITLSDVNKSAYEFFSNKNKRTKTNDQNVDDSDADMAFFRSMLPDVKIMTPNQKRKLKIGILNLVEQILKEPASPIAYSRSFVSSESPYRSTPSRESDYNSPVHMECYGRPRPEQTQTTGAYGGSATQQMQPALQQTQPALQQIQATGAYGGSPTQQMQPALQQTQPALQQMQETGAYTQVYLPMYSPVTPNTPQSHQALRQPHDETDFNDF